MTTQHSPTPYPAPVAPGRRRLSPWLIRLPILAILGGLLLILVLSILLMAYQMQHSDRIFPGVWTMDLNLGGMTADEARTALTDAFTYDEQAVFTLRYGDDYWQLSAGDLGVSLDVEAMITAAFEVGHGDSVVNNVFDQAGAWMRGVSIAPVVQYDQAVALAKLTEIADEINQEPANATLSVVGTTVSTTAGQNGQILDITATQANLDAAVLSLSTGQEITLVVTEASPAIVSTEDAANQLRLALSGPITLVATDQNGNALGPWTVSADQIASLLSVQLVDQLNGTWAYEVGIDMTAFESVLETLAPGLITLPQNGRFHFDETAKELVVIEPSISGRQLNIEQTVVRMEEGVFSADNRTIPMAFDFTLPTYHNKISAAELGITELVGEATTLFTGSTQNRRTNIAVAASKFDGLIIGPGEEFSFNQWLGDITYENGFVDGKVIFGGQTVTGIGGGVCQVSTTIFRAALTGGFHMVEYHSHGYRVGYYELNAPPGLDAAIWTPDSDFRFLNNTPHHMLIETSIFPGSDAIQFRLYSTKFWQAEIEEPQVLNTVPAPPARYILNSDLQPGQVVQVDYAAEGADVTFKRYIYDLEGNLVETQPIFRHYEPWQAVYEVPPGDSRLRGGG